MLARAHALDRLLRMHLGRRREDRRFHARLGQGLVQVFGDMVDAVLVGHLAHLLQPAPSETTSTPSMFAMPSRCF